MDYQKIYLIGNATHAGELKEAKDSGTHYGDFRLAVRTRNQESAYFPVRCFGKLGESVTHIKKGTRLFVEGELDPYTSTDEDGQKRTTFAVIANTYRILDKGSRARKENKAPRS